MNVINEKFNIVLSCHSIEHQIDLIKHLQDISKLLEKDGYYIIIMPDKRYCFDHYISESTIADILDTHYSNRKLHKLKSVIEHRVLTCHNDSLRHWNKDNGEQKLNIEIIKNSINEFINSEKNNIYIDVHSWQFTPDSFRKNINILNELNYIDLKIERIYNTIFNSNEFIAILKK